MRRRDKIKLLATNKETTRLEFLPEEAAAGAGVCILEPRPQHHEATYWPASQVSANPLATNKWPYKCAIQTRYTISRDWRHQPTRVTRRFRPKWVHIADCCPGRSIWRVAPTLISAIVLVALFRQILRPNLIALFICFVSLSSSNWHHHLRATQLRVLLWDVVSCDEQNASISSSKLSTFATKSVWFWNSRSLQDDRYYSYRKKDNQLEWLIYLIGFALSLQARATFKLRRSRSSRVIQLDSICFGCVCSLCFAYSAVARP